MKKLLSILFMFFSATVIAQNVGIGTTTPGYLLDINGRARLMHNGYTSGIWLNKADNTEGVFTGMVNDSTYGFFGNAAVGNWKFGFDVKNAKMGIGISAPTAPLSFVSTVGNKIALWGDANGGHYGLGIQGSLMQLYSSGSNADIALGYGSSAAFTENMRVKGNGNVGIGTNNPAAKLEVAGSLKITDGTQGAGRVLTSDATGKASWKSAAYGDLQRFQFKITDTQAPNNATFSTLYNYGDAYGYNSSSSDGVVLIIINTPGLYHFDVNAYGTINNGVGNEPIELFISKYFPNASVSVSDALTVPTPFGRSSGSIDKSFDMYIPAAITLSFAFYRNAGAGAIFSIETTVTGHKIAD